uniref:Uncharacterized protein LOC100376862 n=1 Tax=Saccoglossus kowalevskii TaxID=10224 RepID=A0ABM0M1I6_SACKO|nr:PREDICTED: uncharacterized protein LOC100376862 [Saccoglossus kowalevskii]
MMADKTTGSREGTYLAADVSPGSKAVTMYTRLLLPGQHPGSYKLTFHFVIPSATKKACRTSDASLRVFVLYTLPSANDASKITSNVEWKSLSSLCNTGGMNSFDACSTLWYIDSTMDTHYGNNWNHVMINVTNKFDHKIVFEARRHSFPSEHCTDFGIDDISITPYST